MPAMSRLEVAACTNAPWRWFAAHIVLPWALQGVVPHGDVLEIGAGSGAMAGALLARHPNVTMTVTDFDEVMVRAATRRLAKFGDRARVQQADATALPFPDASFDAVVTWLMLHHTVTWERALSEAVRVLRPGGLVIGYDLLARGTTRALHRHDATHRVMHLDELRAAAATFPVSAITISPSRGGFVVRFLFRK